MNNPPWLHFIGIKGVGMSALAIVCQGLGYKVTGSDVAEEFITDSSLHDADITPTVFNENNLSSAINTVVLGAAYSDSNLEAAKAKALGLHIITYSEMLGLVSQQKKTLAIAGTHGKTTTTSILTYLLYKSGFDPSWVIGTGHVAGLSHHGGAGHGDYFVTEADDYKRASNDDTPKFLDLTPFGAVITSIEHDHPDLYPTLADCVAAFREFIGRVRDDGFIVANGDDQNIQDLQSEFPNKRFITYGINETVDYRITPSKHGFLLETEGQKIGSFSLQLPGMHNQMNATAAIIVAKEIGMPVDKIIEILPTLQTVERRFQVLGEFDGRVVIDDYAHHPTAIRLTLEAARNQFPNRPLWTVFQPHTYSRTKTLLQEFGTAFAQADQTIVTDIFASARETEAIVTAQDLVEAIKPHQPKVQYLAKSDLGDFLQQKTPPNAVIVLMGAGDIYKIGQALVKSST